MKYIVANWKSNKNSLKVGEWFEKIKEYLLANANKLKNLEIIVCPPLVYLPLGRKLRDAYKLPIKLGAQNVSPFVEGAYTGEITAKQLSELVEYVIVGHSERRMHLGETDELLEKKIEQVKNSQVKSIFCIQNAKTPIPQGVDMVAYEPVGAIGTGQPDTPENAKEIARLLKNEKKAPLFLYGGSVKSDNVLSFIKEESIDGVLVGGASLDPLAFWGIISNASAI